MIHARLLGASVLLGVLALAGCSQGTPAATLPSPAPSPPAAPVASPTVSVPAKFAAGGVRVALVRQLSSGDYFEQWLAGAQAEAQALKVTLEVSSGDGNNDKQALNLEQAVQQKADAIIVDHGFADTVQPAIKKAADAGIPLVAFDVDPGTPKAVALTQDDAQDRRTGARRAEGRHRRLRRRASTCTSPASPPRPPQRGLDGVQEGQPGHQGGRPDRRGQQLDRLGRGRPGQGRPPRPTRT